MSDENVLATLTSKLTQSLASSSLDLFTANGTQSFNFSVCAANVAKVVFQFWKANGRAPNLIFNDGVPPAYKTELSGGNVIAWIPWTREGAVIGDANGGVLYNASFPVLNCKVLVKSASIPYTYFIPHETGDESATAEFNVSGLYPSRFGIVDPSHGTVVTIPLDDVQYGAFQTWGILIVAYTRPEFLVASDDGILLTRDGVAMLEKTLAYFADVFMPGQFSFGMINVDDVVNPGPVGVGVPVALLNQIKTYIDKLKAQDGTLSFFLMIASIAMSFTGFYFGASALSGLVGGAFTLPNLSGSLSLASKFGADTGSLNDAIKVANLVGGDLTSGFSSAITGSTGVAPMLGDAYIDDTLFADAFAELDAWNVRLPDLSGFADSMDYSALSVADLEAINPDFSTALAVNQQVNDSYSGTGESLSSTLASVTGDAPLTAAQLSSAVGTSAQVGGLVSKALASAGTSATSTTATPAQVQQAQLIAAQNAASSGNSLWADASKMLGMYAQYQMTQQQIAAKQASIRLPSQISYPTATNPIVRQPDGSISYRNADGSVSTIKPSGQVVNTAAGQALSFLGNNKVLLIGGGVLAVAAVAAFSRRR